MDEFSEKFQTAFDPAPTPLSLGKLDQAHLACRTQFGDL